MRKTSAKTLSLALSLLLAISVLFSLPFGVWAETEAVPGDLNGDKLVDANDVTILAAVLDGSQTPAADLSFYDISGNKMVDSEDLIVLKNMVDPEEPALADKLADGTTEDLVSSLVSSADGGAVQSAVVHGGGAITPDCPRGSSTKALELNGGAMTLLFAETQDWSGKAALEMDTLWLSGDRTVNVVLLGADGKTILGAPGEVTAQENGWSRISVPLTGILATERAKVGGIMITVADDAHVYMDNLAMTAAEEETDVLTRAEMENALTEMAWNWFFKGSAYQYDSTPLNSVSQPKSQPLAGYGGGKSRLTLFPTLEDATSHSNVYTVCSGFAYDMYLAALDYPILGAKYNSLTMTFWRNSSYYPEYAPDAENAYDMTVLRWHSLGKGNIYSDYDNEFFNYYKDENGNIVFNNWYDKEAVITFFNEKDENGYPKNFRPGDIIVYDNPSHTVIYIGNGMVMDSNGSKTVLDTVVATGGGKYDMTTGADNPELEGSVSYRTFYDVFLNPANTTMNIEVALGKATNHIVVLRPLNLLTIDDGDGDPSNDQMDPDYVLNTGLLKYQLEYDTTHEVKTSDYGISETTATRLQYPGMNIDRTVDITPYGTAIKGDTLTYSVKITNNSADTNYVAFRQDSGDTDYAGEDYEGLWVVEHIPEGTELVEIPEGATRVGDTLRWNVTVPAGEAVELTYTVTVTGEIGDTIVSGGGWVNNIPSNTITNIIGGKSLSAKDQADMAAIDVSGITATGTDLAEQIYKTATDQDLELPEVSELMDIFYAEYTYSTSYGYYLYYNSSGITRYMYKLNAKSPTIEDKLYYDMLVPNYYGGMWCYTDEYNGEPRIGELREEYLEVGDILVYMDLTDQPLDANGEPDCTQKIDKTVEGYTVLVYLGDGTFASVNQDGTVTTRTDEIAYTEAFKHDLFLCLRPSQSYEDLSGEGIPSYTVTWEDAEGNVVETDEGVPYRNVPTYDGEELTKDGCTFAGWSPAVRPADGHITYKPIFISRDLSEGKLTDSELDALAAITPETVQDAFAYYALKSVNLDVVLPWIYQQAGLSVPSELSTNKIYATRNKFFNTSGGLAVSTSIAAPYTTMLVTNAYGGSLMKEGAVPGFDIGYLQIGDIFCAAFDAADIDVLSSTKYYTFLYQGDGKFLSISEDAAVYTTEEVLDKKYGDTNYGWSYYFVIRPENYNSATRDITLRSLTDAEKYALSKLTTDEIKYPSYHIKSNVIRFYDLVGINDFMTLSDGSSVTNSSVSELMFTTGTARVPKAATTDNQRYYQRMMLPCYGGSYVASDITLTDAIADGILQIGDVVSGVMEDDYTAEDGTTGSANTQFTALYQGIDETGKGKFVILYRDYTTSSSAYSNATTVMYVDEVDERLSTYYYTLRPEMLAVTGDSFTVTWVDDDGTVLETDTNAVGTLPSYEGATPAKTDAQYTYTFAGWTPLTTSVNRDVTYTATYTTAVNNYTVTWKNGDVELETDVDVPYGTMPSYNGATPTKDADTQYSYTFAGWDKEISEVTGDVTYTAVFDAYRFLTVHDLNDEELDALTSITPEDVKAAITSKDLAGTNLNSVAPWIYKQAHIDCATEFAYFDSGSEVTVYSLRWQLLTSTGVYPTSKNPAYCPMLVTNAYGFPRDGASYLDLDYLQAGDLFCGSYLSMGTDKETAHFVYLYQGNGKFLLMNEDSDIYYWQDIKNQTYTYEEQKYDWSYYYVIRPENFNGDRVRDITLRGLTEAEEYRLSLLTASEVEMQSMHLHTTLPEYFKQIGITMDMKSVSTSLTHDGTLGLLFVWQTGGRVPVEATSDLMYYAQKMMVGCYGGYDFAEASRLTLTDAIAGKVLKIGDVVAGKYEDADFNNAISTFTALYQGGNKFLVQYQKFNASENAQTYQTAVLTAGEIDDLTFKYYFTLRPENLATVSDDDTFTVTWVNEDGTVLETDENVALYAHPNYDGATPTKAPTTHYTYTFAGWTPLPSAINSDVTYKATYSYVRDIVAHELTEGEMKALSKVDITVGLCDGYDMNTILPKTYTAAGVDITTAYGYVAGTGNNIRKALFGNTNCKPLTAETTPTPSLFNFYRHMLVDGVYGGSAFAEPGDKALSEENLQIGDIFCAQVPASRVVGSYTFGTGNSYFVLVYQGNGQFDGCLNVSKTGTTKASGDWNGATVEQMQKIAEANAFGYYYVLRPNMLTVPRTITWVDADGTVLETDTVSYGTVPTYDGATPTKTKEGYTYTFEGWDKDVVAAVEDATYTATYSYVRDLTAHDLTNGEMAALAAITPDDVKASLSGSNIGAVAPWVYEQIHIDCSSEFSATLPNGKSMSVHWLKTYLIGSTNETYSPMLVTDAYGGTSYDDRFELNVDTLQVGDLFCSSFFGSDAGNVYYVYLYQGNGKFLYMHKTDADVYTLEEVLTKTSAFGGVEEGWSYWYVIRPENYNGDRTRDITLRNLTSAEKYQLSKLTTMGYPTRNLYGTMPAYYEAIGITMETTKAYNKTHEGTRDMLFKWSDSVLVPAEATNATMRHFQKMAVGVQGGGNFAVADRVDISDAIDGGVLQIGDVLAGYHRNVYTLDGVEKSEDVVFTAMYQGNNTFLVYYYAHEDGAKDATMTRTTWTTDQVEALDFYWFYTLRPDNLAN